MDAQERRCSGMNGMSWAHGCAGTTMFRDERYVVGGMDAQGIRCAQGAGSVQERAAHNFDFFL
ncbi:MAG: hypothetical protein ACI845_004405 [Gammaproteobacteria bacterium]|jgi:hypothetical protein